MFLQNIYLAEIAPAQLRGKIVGSSVIWSAFGVTMGECGMCPSACNG